ncbi:hypothetical protein GF336_04710 [Candidatus Woesearchaeota archaeon]|nr:hypothetical protein [Candidatus Woesearchaeota archaeon]
MGVKQEISYLIENIKFNLASAMEYKFNFLFMTTSMILNNVFLLLFWWILFDKFKEMNGWMFQDFMMLMAVVSVAIGLSRTLFYNARKLHKNISEGGLDYYIVLPKSILLNSIVKIDYAGIGDLVFGILIGVLAIDPINYPLFIVLVILSSIIYTSFILIINSSSFFIGKGESLSNSLELGIIVFSTYPFSLFGGLSRFLLLTIIPAGFVGGIPVGILKSFNWQWFLILLGFTVLIALLAYLIFRIGLKRYESGNLIVVRE